jgi:hypothetical protein
MLRYQTAFFCNKPFTDYCFNRSRWNGSLDGNRQTNRATKVATLNLLEKESIMKSSQKWIIGIGASLSLAAAAVYAHPGQMGGATETGMQHGMSGGMGHGAMGHGTSAPQAARQLMTPEERTALQEKMRNAKTPEERQQIAAATRTEMQKRAQEKGITLPEHRGMHGRRGAGPNAAPAAPGASEHAH